MNDTNSTTNTVLVVLLVVVVGFIVWFVMVDKGTPEAEPTNVEINLPNLPAAENKDVIVEPVSNQ